MKLWRKLFRLIWNSVVGKLWATIILLVAFVLLILGVFLLRYIDVAFSEPKQVQLLYVVVGIIGFLLSTLLAFFLSTKIQQPLLQLKKAADSISQGNYKMRVEIRSSDEIGELGKTFNRMTDELDRLIHDLSHEKEQLSRILRSMGDAVMSFDADGQIILTNPPGEKLIGRWAEVDKTWRKEEDGEPNLQEVPAPLRDSFDTVIEEGKEIFEKLQVQNSVWSLMMAPLRSEGVTRGAVAVIRDVTEEHMLDKMRRDLLANISHEIRTPLSMLQGYSEALLDDIPTTPEERNELVQIIYDESLRMGRLVADLLDLTRMEAGHTELHLQSVDLQSVIVRVHRKFLVYAKDREVELRVNLSPEPLTVEEADIDRIEQILTNLLDNAFRYTPPGKSITIAAQPIVQNSSRFIQIKVIDEGKGIPSEDVPYVFERFYKADKARKREATGGGTGLGLAIVQNLVQLHRGRIQVESTVGAGTTFTLLLPVEAASSVHAPN
ncbi:ATP-binding protein [Paenibacillus protaetiae]|uniref:histidine kinase n=1 Tax=Paenibacillus protaetiae TaxID=2509456 RepID=A0A4P6EUN3_9BACL|nr:ATP-binding protein [Paenibacillus protaetiae]QAY66195.1 HAMP domain-containing protein [Paenibacillus protaetiae]